MILLLQVVCGDINKLYEQSRSFREDNCIHMFENLYDKTVEDIYSTDMIKYITRK